MASADTPSPSLWSNARGRLRRAKGTTSSTAYWSLVLSILWFAGAGSLVGLVLGVRDVRRSQVSEVRQNASGVAYAGIVVGVVGIVLAAIVWSEAAGVNAVTSSPSYIDGSNFAMMAYPNATSEASLCVASNAQSYDNPTQWLQGCRDGWFLAAHSFTNPGMPGLNAG